jgi:hypothetical protein
MNMMSRDDYLDKMTDEYADNMYGDEDSEDGMGGFGGPGGMGSLADMAGMYGDDGHLEDL